MGYLFMEYIPGQTLEDLDFSSSDNISGPLANVVSVLGMVTGDDITWVNRRWNVSRILVGDSGTGETFEDMNCWLHKRLQLIDKMIDLRPYPPMFCHLDVCRRNINFMGDNSICLLDWGHTGFFPRFFEAAAASCVNDDTTYGKSFLQAIRMQSKIVNLF